MARLLKPGDSVAGLVVEKHLYTGRDAISYRVRSQDELFFLKQYKSPSCLVGWYEAYKRYQKEIGMRLRGRDVPWIAPVAAFESTVGMPTFFQIFSLADSSDMEQLLAQPCGITPKRRLDLARQLVAALARLHKTGIVHADLKPANILLVPHTIQGAESHAEQAKLVDFDFSLLEHETAPWHNQQGYKGSPCYYSPEHVQNLVPCRQSDIYSCGLVLYELLDRKHPYALDDAHAYMKAMLAFEARPPRLDMFAHGEELRALQDCMHACLAPAAADRPTPADLWAALNRLQCDNGSPNPQPNTRPSPGSRTLLSPVPHADSPPAADCLLLEGEVQGRLEVRIRSVVGRALLEAFGPDARYASHGQFVLMPGNGTWFIEPDLSAVNDTLVNGARLQGRLRLRDGDIVSIGRESRGLSLLPVRVRLPLAQAMQRSNRQDTP